MQELYDNTKKSRLTNTTKENNYYYEPTIKTARNKMASITINTDELKFVNDKPEIKMARKPLIHPEMGAKMGEEITTTYKICTNGCISKQQLIFYLENKIDHINKLINPKKNLKPYGEELHLLENSLNCYKEVLDFVKGDKNV